LNDNPEIILGKIVEKGRNFSSSRDPVISNAESGVVAELQTAIS